MYKCLAAGNDWFTFNNNAAYTTRMSNQQTLSYPNILTDHSRMKPSRRDLRSTSLNGLYTDRRVWIP